MQRRLGGISIYRVGGLVAVGTTVLTASLMGLLAVITGTASGIPNRIPVYAVLTAAAFVVSVVLQEEVNGGQHRTLTVAAGTAVVSLVVLGLSIEGVIYAATNPGRVVASQTLLYLLSAGMIGTGVGYWGLRNWRTLRRETRRSLRT